MRLARHGVLKLETLTLSVLPTWASFSMPLNQWLGRLGFKTAAVSPLRLTISQDTVPGMTW